MKLSVITPTEERPAFLKGQYQLLKNQTYTDWEWLIHDMSLNPLEFPDKRVRVFHEKEKILSVGKKRNFLAEQAKGEAIVHFDDDDYYAPTYLQTVFEKLKTFDFFNIHSWFAFHLGPNQFYYWDTEEEGITHYMIDSMTGMRVREIDFGPELTPQAGKIKKKGRRGYGFSFAYLKRVWEKHPFKDKDFAEDTSFYNAVEKSGAAVFSAPDRDGIVVHILHESNLSRIFPQYRIPRFLIEEKMAPFLAYVETLSHED